MVSLSRLGWMIAVLVLGAAHAEAGLIIDIENSFGDLTATTSGSINTTSLPTMLGLFGPGATGGLVDYGVGANTSRGLATSGTPSFSLFGDTSFTGPTYPFLEVNDPFDSSSGDATGLGFTANFGGRLGVYIPTGYISGSPLAALGIWNSTTFANLGVNDGDTFTWNWGSGDSADFLTINVGSAASAAVPEPANIAIWSLIALGIAGFGYHRLRRK